MIIFILRNKSIAYIKKKYYLCSRKGLKKQNKIYTI